MPQRTPARCISRASVIVSRTPVVASGWPSLLYLLGAVGFGLLISTLVNTQALAFQVTLLGSLLLGAFFVEMGAVVLVPFFFAPLIARLVAPGFASDPVLFPELVLLTRILLLQPIFLGASNLLANLTQSGAESPDIATRASSSTPTTRHTESS